MLTKLAYSIPSLAEAVDLSVASIREAIDKGDLIPVYPNRKPLIPIDEAKRWLDSLPQESPKKRAS